MSSTFGDSEIGLSSRAGLSEPATLVLGSTQVAPPPDRLEGVVLARRRSGGGAVLLSPGDHIWCDVWIPRDDNLWTEDALEASWWVGEWWASILHEVTEEIPVVHRGPGGRSPACFAALGAGEVTMGGKKVVGVAQWRCREGALFHSCGYLHWDPAPLRSILEVNEAELSGAGALGVSDGDEFERALLEALPGIEAH